MQTKLPQSLYFAFAAALPKSLDSPAQDGRLPAMQCYVVYTSLSCTSSLDASASCARGRRVCTTIVVTAALLLRGCTCPSATVSS